MPASAAFCALALLVSVQLRLGEAAHAHRGEASASSHSHHLTRQERARSKAQESATDSFPSGGSSDHKIPSLLHHIYLRGYAAFVEDTKGPGANLTKDNYEFCQSAHRHWDLVFWDEQAAVQMLKEHYPWFMPVWESYDNEAKKSDALRAFIMHRFGGLYLDLDVECYRAADDSFKDYDVVLQGTGDEGINNAVVASVPGHPLWQHYAKVLVERSKQGIDPMTRGAMWMSGTLALSRTLFDYIVSPKKPVSGYLGGEFPMEGTIIKIYPIGEWYVPCYGLDTICLKQFAQRREGGEWDMTNIYGRHYFAEIAQPHMIEERLKPQHVNR